MKTVRRLAIGLAILALAAGVTAAAEYTEKFDQTYPLAAGGRIGLENINGDVIVRVWDRAEVRVEALKEAEEAEALEALVIDVDASERAIDIETHYPSSDGWGGFWKRGHGHTQVTYTLTVPKGAALGDIELVNGDLEVTGVTGGIRAETVNGAISVREVRGEVELATVNGSLDVLYEMLAASDRVDLESVNGTIELTLPSGAGAHVEAETVNGRIRNDFGIDVQKGRWVGSSMRGTLGGGGALVTLETVNGAISVKSR